ncbi:MAG: outer membrane protein [Stellaceae bacterium]
MGLCRIVQRVAAAAIGAAFAGIVGAACALAQAPSQSAPGEPISPPQWTGPWVGAAALGGWSNSAISELAAQSGGLFHRFDTLGIGGGGEVSFGYDWRPQRNKLVAGLVGEIGFVHDPGGHVLRTTTNLIGSAQLRLGIAASPAMLLYGQSGIAFDNQSVAIDFGGPTMQQNRVTPGITLGAGAEYVIIAPPHPPLGATTSIFAEFQHVWWASDAIDMPAAVPGLDFQWQRQSNIVKAGIRVRF